MKHVGARSSHYYEAYLDFLEDILKVQPIFNFLLDQLFRLFQKVLQSKSYKLTITTITNNS